MSPPNDHLPQAELEMRLRLWALRTSRFPLFKGSSDKLGAWFLIVERACRESDIPSTQRTESAILLIFESEDRPLQAVMRERQCAYLEKSDEAFWPWTTFKLDIIKVVTESEGTGWNWKKIAGIALMVGGAAMIVPAVGLLAVNLVGFGSGGVAAGSLAAFLQSVFYGGATGGIFSFFQMLGATATFPAIEALIVGFIATRAGRALGR